MIAAEPRSPGRDRARSRDRGLRHRFVVASALAIAVSGLAVDSSSIASADTARLVRDERSAPRGPARATIVITGTDGGVRTLGPYRFPAVPYGLRRSPDGRYFAVPWENWRSNDRGLTIVPTDGGAPFVVRPRRPGGGSYYTSHPEKISWSSDSRDLILGNTEDDDGNERGDVVRCSVARRRCAAIPGVSGYAATVPGAVVTSTVDRDLVSWIEGYATVPEYPDAEKPADRPTRRALERRRHAQTVRVTPRRTRALLRRRATVLDGVDATAGIVGGPSAALVALDRYRLRRVERRGETFVRWAGVTRRWVIVGQRGSTVTVRPRPLLVPKAHGALVEDDDLAFRVRSQREIPRPQAAIASGGWLAVTGWSPAVPGLGGLVLTTITPRGRAAFVRTGGQIASATQLVRSVLARRIFRGTAALVVVGHEAATNAAIVALSWDEPDPQPGDAPPAALPGLDGVVPLEGPDLRRNATVRVPLDGRTPPTVVSGTKEQAAW